MPYISEEDRKQADMVRLLRAITKAVESGAINCRGHMNFVSYFMGKRYVENKGASYHNHSDVCAALIDCAEEYRRREMNPYEDKKIEENGDVE